MGLIGWGKRWRRICGGGFVVACFACLLYYSLLLLSDPRQTTINQQTMELGGIKIEPNTPRDNRLRSVRDPHQHPGGQGLSLHGTISHEIWVPTAHSIRRSNNGSYSWSSLLINGRRSERNVGASSSAIVGFLPFDYRLSVSGAKRTTLRNGIPAAAAVAAMVAAAVTSMTNHPAVLHQPPPPRLDLINPHSSPLPYLSSFPFSARLPPSSPPRKSPITPS